MERIVVGFDGSEQARKALERAAEIADGATLAVVCAAEARTAALATARSFLDQRGIEAVYIEGHGKSADVLVQEAEESGADLIVAGTRGLNAARRLVLGSVSTNVVQHAPCDVLVVR